MTSQITWLQDGCNFSSFAASFSTLIGNISGPFALLRFNLFNSFYAPYVEIFYAYTYTFVVYVILLF